MTLAYDFIAFLDTETTGLVPGRDQVTEIATILTDLDLNEIARYHQRTYVSIPVPPEVAAINGYDAAVWAREALPFDDWMNWLSDHVPRGHVAIPVGHNVSFDRDIIDRGYYKPRGLFCPLGLLKIDTVQFALTLRCAGLLDTPNYKLTTVSEALGIKHDAHRAMGDCLVSMEIFRRAVRSLRGGADIWRKVAADQERQGEPCPKP